MNNRGSAEELPISINAGRPIVPAVLYSRSAIPISKKLFRGAAIPRNTHEVVQDVYLSCLYRSLMEQSYS
jgi:hypothetical protein